MPPHDPSTISNRDQEPHPTWMAVTKYLIGEATSQESSAVERWSVSHPRWRSVMPAVQAWWREGSDVTNADPASASQVADALTAVRHRAGLRGQEGKPGGARIAGWRERQSTAMPWRRAALMVAATVSAIAIVVGWGGHHDRQQTHPRHVAMMTYTTGRGERATISLPDGGTVALNVASRLDVPMDYMAGDRVVRLTGEGLFTATHHAGTPLTVDAGGTVTRVLGTSFVVRHYATDTTAMIAVRDGKVAVGAAVVTANHLAEVGQSGVARIRVTDRTPFSFATGLLTISDMALPAAIVELDRWFDVDIRLGDPALARRHITATFGAGSLGDLVEFFGSLYDVRVVRDGRVLTLYPRG